MGRSRERASTRPPAAAKPIEPVAEGAVPENEHLRRHEPRRGEGDKPIEPLAKWAVAERASTRPRESRWRESTMRTSKTWRRSGNHIKREKASAGPQAPR